jgi:calcium channel MID1
VHSLAYCPSIAYAVPIAEPAFPATAHSSSTLPDSVVDPLLSALTNFTTSLTTFACGRDDYSPIVTCADCQQAYRKWLCAIWFPRCSEAAPDTAGTTNDGQKPVSIPATALQPQASGTTPRSPGLAPFASAYTVLLPCLETCTAVDRACPNMMGFKCPIPRFNAGSSYGVGFIDSGEEGVEGGGLTGVAEDRFGNVWCNGG